MDARKHRLLVVDDDKLIADTTALIFSSEGYEARAVYSAEDALELMPGWQPSVIILDVLLPGMNGIAFAQMVATKWPRCRIILFSSQVGFTDRFPDVSDRFLVLAKPIAPTELLSVVGASLEVV